MATQTIPDSLNVIFGPGQRIESPNFSGPVWVERMLIIEDEDQPVPLGNVTFPPMSRSNWHYHSAGQTLLVLDGIGYYQEEGEAVQVLHKGDKVKCPPNVHHWHGAAATHWFVQLALTKEHPAGRVIWGEPVTDKQYQAGLKVEGMSLRYYHFARVAGLATRGELEELEVALNAALNGGLQVEELREALVHLHAYAGFPRSIQGLKILLAMVEDRRERKINIDVMVGSPEERQNIWSHFDYQSSSVDVRPERTPATAIAEGKVASKTANLTRYEQGLETLEELTGRNWSEPSDYGKFAPRIDTFLKEHLFAVVFEDQTLSYADREVITVAVLSALSEGVEPMLNSHANIARREGVSELDLRMILRVSGY